MAVWKHLVETGKGKRNIISTNSSARRSCLTANFPDLTVKCFFVDFEGVHWARNERNRAVRLRDRYLAAPFEATRSLYLLTASFHLRSYRNPVPTAPGR